MNSENLTPKDVITIFNKAQKNSAVHLKYAVVLKKAFDVQNENKELLDQVLTCINLVVTADDAKRNNPFIRNLTNFIITLCSHLKIKRSEEVEEDEDAADHPVLYSIFMLLLDFSDVTLESWRYWCCFLIHKIFDKMEELSSELYDKVKVAMLERLMDPKADIRIEAVMCLHRLQDPTDPEDPITLQFGTILSGDRNSKIRQVCVEKIALNKQVLPLLIKRIRDVDSKVRLQAFQRITPLAKFLKVSQKRNILHCGFLDSSEIIKDYVKRNLLPAWLELYENDFLKLMKAIRLDACEEDINRTVILTEKMLNVLFQSKSVNSLIDPIQLNENQLIKYEDLTWDLILYYRVVIEYLRQSEDYVEYLNRILPELVDFSKYIIRYCEFVDQLEEFDPLEYYFTLQQFFLITLGYDVSDSAGRKSLTSLAHHMLQKMEISIDVAELVMRNLEKTIVNVKDRSIFVCEIVTNIMYGEDGVDYEELQKKEIERQQQISQLRSDLRLLRERESSEASEKRFSAASSTKDEAEQKLQQLEDLENGLSDARPETNLERKTDAPTVIRYLTVAEALLSSPSITELNPSLSTLCSEVIQKALLHPSDEAKTKAFKCFALCAIVDKETARYGIHLFSASIFHNNDCCNEILIASIHAVVDLLLAFGVSLVENPEEEEMSDSRNEDQQTLFKGGTSLAGLIKNLANLVDHDDAEVEEAATKGVCMLLMHACITSSSLLSRMIIKWANPATDNERLKQFVAFALNRMTELPTFPTYYPEAITKTLNTLVYAPKNSALVDVNIDNILKFMLALGTVSSQGTAVSWDLTRHICDEIRQRPNRKVNLVYSKALLLIKLPTDCQIINELIELCDELIEVIRDRQVSRNVIKFQTNLKVEKTKLCSIAEE